MRNARHGYAMTTHKLQGQTVDSLVIDVGPDRDLSSAYVAFTRHRDDVLAVVNIADIADGDQIAALMAAGPDARRDAVIAMTAERIAARGFTEQPTAHDVLRTPPSRYESIQTQESGWLLDADTRHRLPCLLGAYPRAQIWRVLPTKG
jgi:hypothetical protein